ncbi:DUF4232 domain-containing protein [Nocardia sp. NPDC051030]|uniref:DUF4232 domain-containing protein n=1 Tax=Nocardia sp. NPDC051030 TaxID=3155162 RepID=UPI00341E28D8
MSRQTTRFARILLCCALAGLASCATSEPGPSGTPSGTTRATTQSNPSSAPATAPVTAPETTPGTPPGTVPAGTPAVRACGSGQVDTTVTNLGAAMLHRGLQLTFTLNPGNTPCTLTGYPGVDAYDNGTVIHADRTPRGYIGGLPQGDDTLPAVLLDSTHTAQAVIEAVAVHDNGEGCTVSPALLVTPPNTTSTVTLGSSIATCRLQIHPVTAS